MKLDSVAESMDCGGGGMGTTTDLLRCQDEKPMMTFGIADYPSLGFKEELAGMGGPMQTTNSCNTLYGSLSKFISILNSSMNIKEEKSSDPEAGRCEGMGGMVEEVCVGGGVWREVSVVWGGGWWGTVLELCTSVQVFELDLMC